MSWIWQLVRKSVTTTEENIFFCVLITRHMYVPSYIKPLLLMYNNCYNNRKVVYAYVTTRTITSDSRKGKEEEPSKHNTTTTHSKMLEVKCWIRYCTFFLKICISKIYLFLRKREMKIMIPFKKCNIDYFKHFNVFAVQLNFIQIALMFLL